MYTELKVTNEYGTEIFYNVAEQLMDADICEMLHSEIAPCSEQQFFDAYCKAHEVKYGEVFELAKQNPVY